MPRNTLCTLTAVFTACDALTAHAQTSDSLPPGWSKSGSTPTDYIVAVDRAIYRTGQASGQLRSRSAIAQPTGTLTQRVRADAFKGARIRVSAWLRTREVKSALLFVRVDGPGTVLDFANTASSPLDATADWRQLALVVDVPATALGVTFGVVLNGPGTLWIDDVALEIVPPATPRTAAPPPAAAASPGLERTLRERYAAEPVQARNLGFEEPVRASAPGDASPGSPLTLQLGAQPNARMAPTH